MMATIEEKQRTLDDTARAVQRFDELVAKYHTLQREYGHLQRERDEARDTISSLEQNVSELIWAIHDMAEDIPLRIDQLDYYAFEAARQEGAATVLKDLVERVLDLKS